MATTIKPTIGRRVWLWTTGSPGVREQHQIVQDAKQAFDATVVFVHPDGRINVSYRDHHGTVSKAEHLDLRDPGDDGHGHGSAPYCTWMPYQVGQAKAAAA